MNGIEKIKCCELHETRKDGKVKISPMESISFLLSEVIRDMKIERKIIRTEMAFGELLEANLSAGIGQNGAVVAIQTSREIKPFLSPMILQISGNTSQIIGLDVSSNPMTKASKVTLLQINNPFR
jgi:hypothetical protein